MDSAFDGDNPFRQPVFREILFALVHHLEFAAVDRDRIAVSRCMPRQGAMKRAQTLRMAGPVSRRKSAIVLKSGLSWPVSHISSMLR